MELLDGNSSDKESFHNTTKKVEDFKKQLDVDKNFKWVAYSAVYTTDKLLRNNSYLWLIGVPEIITEAKKLITTKVKKLMMLLASMAFFMIVELVRLVRGFKSVVHL